MALTTEDVLTTYCGTRTILATARITFPDTNHKIKGRILLHTRLTQFLICPLLPLDQPKHALAIPEEIWRQVFRYVCPESRQGLLLASVCQAFKVRGLLVEKAYASIIVS